MFASCFPFRVRSAVRWPFPASALAVPLPPHLPVCALVPPSSMSSPRLPVLVAVRRVPTRRRSRFSPSRLEAGDERLEAFDAPRLRCCAIRPRAGHLLELRHQPLDCVGRANGTASGRGISLSARWSGALLAPERFGERVRLTQVPRFQLLARDADQRIVPTSWATWQSVRSQTEQCLGAPDSPLPSLSLTTANRTPGSRHARSLRGTCCAPDRPLPSCGTHWNKQARKQSGQQSVEEHAHRLLLEEQNESAHAGSAPSKSRCFQSAPGRIALGVQVTQQLALGRATGRLRTRPSSRASRSRPASRR